MKNKLLLSVTTVALVASLLTSCREKTDFDAIVNDLSKQTLQGYFSGAETQGPEMKLNVIQYQFLEDGSVDRSVMAVGDGVYQAPVSRKFSSWTFGEYYDGKAGRFLNLNPADGGEPLKVKFYANSILEDGQPMASDHNDKIGTILTTQEALVGKKWYGNDTVFHKVDTVIDVIKYDTVYTYKPKKDENGNVVKDEAGFPVYEQTIKSITETVIPTKMKWIVAPKSINIRSLELYRDASSLVNTGKWSFTNKEYDMDANRNITTRVDTTASYDFHWCFVSYTSTSSFVIRAVQEDGTVEFFDVRFDAKLPSVTLDKQVLKVTE